MRNVCFAHLVDIRERFLIGGVMVPEADFVRAFLEVQAVCEKWTARGELHPTYFEFLFYMGLCIFRNAGVEFWSWRREWEVHMM